MPLSDRLRRLEDNRRDRDVDVWVTEPDGMLRNTRTGERRRSDELAGAIEVTLTIDRAREDGQLWD